MNRRKFFCILWASVFLNELRFHGIGTLVGPFFGSAIVAFSMPGWGLVWLFRHIWPPLVTSDIGIAFVGACTFWFFPSARLLHLAGTHNPFAKASAARPWFSTRLATVLDWTDQRLFGRQKTGRWG